MRVQEKQPCKVLIDATRSAYGDRQEDDGVRHIRIYLTIMPYLYSSCLVQGPVRLRSTGAGHSVCERSVCTLSGTSIAVMSHCDINHECARREPIDFSACQDNIILDLDVTPFIASRRRYSMGFNSVTNRAQEQSELIHDPFVRWKCCRWTLTRLNVITVRVKIKLTKD